MEYLLALAIVALVVTVFVSNTTVRQTQLVAAEERDVLIQLHGAERTELLNRIQQPERASHVSISENAAPAEPFVHPDIQEERDLIGQ